jgi:hypothetical protein
LKEAECVAGREGTLPLWRNVRKIFVGAESHELHVKGSECYPFCISRKLTEVPFDVRPFLSAGLNYLQRVSDFTVSYSVLAEKSLSPGLFKTCALIMPSKHKMDVFPDKEIGKDNECPKKAKVSCLLLQDSDNLTEFDCLRDNYKPKDINLLTELKHDVKEGAFDCNKKEVHSFSCSDEVKKADTALNCIDPTVIPSEPNLHDKVQEEEPVDVCDNINLESVTVPSSGAVLEDTTLNVVGTCNNKVLDSRSTYSSQKGKVKKLHSLVIKSALRKKHIYLSETAGVDQKSRRIKRNKTEVDELTEPIADTELNVVGFPDSDKCSKALDINHKCTVDNRTEGTRELFYGAECNGDEQSEMQDFRTSEHVFFPRVHSSQKGKVKRSHSSGMKSAQREKSKSSYYISVVNEEPRKVNRANIKGDECTEDTEPTVGAGK